MEKTTYFDRSRKDEWAFEPYTPEEHEKLDRFLDAAGISPGHKVLEPGCGTGRLTEKLSMRIGPQGEVTAVDISAGMIEECRKRAGDLPNVKIIHGPVEEAVFPVRYFDAIFCLCVFPHFDDKAKVLRLFRKWLTPGGSLTLAHLEGSRILNKMHRDAGGAVEEDRIPPFSKMESLLLEAGFRVSRFRDQDDGYLLVAHPDGPGREKGTQLSWVLARPVGRSRFWFDAHADRGTAAAGTSRIAKRFVRLDDARLS